VVQVHRVLSLVPPESVGEHADGRGVVAIEREDFEARSREIALREGRAPVAPWDAAGANPALPSKSMGRA
jgi:hypothetical protein